MIVTGGSILLAIMPRRVRFEAPGPRLERSEQPRLFEEISAVAEATGQPVPEEVYLSPELNAAVTEAGGWFGFGGRKVLIVGLALMEVLTPRQLRAVIAHEYGHYVGQDAKFRAWTWRTRAAVFRTLDALDDEESWGRRLIRKPFEWYARLFLRLTNAVSRRQEFHADAVAAGVAGQDAHVAALRAIHFAAPAFDPYWHVDAIPALEAGVRPPLAKGYRLFLSSHGVRGGLGALRGGARRGTVGSLREPPDAGRAPRRVRSAGG